MSRTDSNIPRNTVKKIAENYKKHLSKYAQSDDDSEFEVMHVQGTNTLKELNVQTKYFNLPVPDFLPKAPFYAESLTTVHLGTVPVSPASGLNILIKLEDIMEEDLLKLYRDAGVALFRNVNTEISILFPQITHAFYGVMTYKINMGDYFETTLTRIFEGYEISLNKETTGFESLINILQDDAATLRQALFRIDMSWNHFAIPRSLNADFPDGVRIHANVLVKTTLIPTLPVAVSPTPEQLELIHDTIKENSVLFKATEEKDKQDTHIDHKTMVKRTI